MRVRSRAWLLAIGVGLVALDVGVRLFFIPLSGDRMRLRTYSARSRSERNCPEGSIVLVGNSAAELGVDSVRFRHGLASASFPQACVDLLLADGSGMTTWRATLRHHYWTPGRRIGLLVLVASPDALRDEFWVDAGRLGSELTTGAEWRAVFGSDSLPRSVVADAALSAAWATWSVRRLIWRRLTRPLEGPFPSPIYRPLAPSHFALRDLLVRSASLGTPVVIARFPVSSRPPADLIAESQLRNAGACVLDAGIGAALATSDYATEFHLRPSGRGRYTRALIDGLLTLDPTRKCIPRR